MQLVVNRSTLFKSCFMPKYIEYTAVEREKKKVAPYKGILSINFRRERKKVPYDLEFVLLTS